ncbi:MAG: M48 family metallopeptidase [Rhodocyclaceae bacterium]|nr:M48 family metallopeptidase [Rhodocyclaceae bacterium]MBK6555414.1 M48 family metallopeptidase [Rhodocyclaceae bacterium]MBK6676681.1 M48 family metallopeptidase [Rhodocyclaceae bacterium]MBK7815593.1 M48 family metallopeptidase [Rhodocyclaceae bacterium]MBK9309306.1 M48 family metallopeptidase [Rhodocyclaceae bacterium]
MATPLFALLLAATPAVLAEGLPDLGESAQLDLSPQMERRIGESIMRDIRLREPGYVDDPEINGYLNRLGRGLARQSDEAKQEFEFFALRDATLNAFAMPGGYIGVHTGLILAAQSESELASVLAHEISHVTQRHLARMVSKQSEGQLAGLAALAVAILAARSNPDAAIGAALAGQAAGIQHQLNYSRDFEREADRVGLQLLEKSGYDIRGMGSFFERLQRFGRLYENNAPAYLRTHPLTTERIADMGNRIQQRPYRQAPDSTDFVLVRAKLRAEQGTPREAVADFESQTRERKFVSEPGAIYGLARAYLRNKNLDQAEHQLAALRRLKTEAAMVETLAAELRTARGDLPGVAAILRAASARYPQDRAIAYALVEALLANHRAEEALNIAATDVQGYTTDARMRHLQAKAYAFLGRRLSEHRTQAEAYILQGQLNEAIAQLQLAQQAPDGDFYERSQVDARLREIKARHAEELKRKKP